jgi:hypothetical protein
MTFLFEIKVQGVSLWYFHVYMYCNSNWFISSIFLHSATGIFVLGDLFQLTDFFLVWGHIFFVGYNYSEKLFFDKLIHNSSILTFFFLLLFYCFYIYLHVYTLFVPPLLFFNLALLQTMWCWITSWMYFVHILKCILV